MKIEETKNHSMFKPHGEQQPCNPNHVKRIMASMKRNGFIKAKPVHVYRDGKFFRVIDGHHRVAAAQNLGISVFYVVGEREESELIADENWAVRKWQSSAFINMFTLRGYPDYVVLSRYIKSGVPAKYAITLLCGESTASGNQCERIRNGTYKIKTTKHADDVLSLIESCGVHSEVAKSDQFISCICVLVHLPEFKKSRLESRIKAAPSKLSNRLTRLQMMEHIEEIYNYRMSDKVCLGFLASNFLRERNKTQRKEVP